MSAQSGKACLRRICILRGSTAEAVLFPCCRRHLTNAHQKRQNQQRPAICAGATEFLLLVQESGPQAGQRKKLFLYLLQEACKAIRSLRAQRYGPVRSQRFFKEPKAQQRCQPQRRTAAKHCYVPDHAFRPASNLGFSVQVNFSGYKKVWSSLSKCRGQLRCRYSLVGAFPPLLLLVLLNSWGLNFETDAENPSWIGAACSRCRHGAAPWSMGLVEGSGGESASDDIREFPLLSLLQCGEAAKTMRILQRFRGSAPGSQSP